MGTTNIIGGEQISLWHTISIGIATAKNEDRNGKHNKFVVFKVRDCRNAAAKPKNLIIWEEDDPEIIAACEAVAQPYPNDSERKIVKMSDTGCKVVRKGFGRLMNIDLKVDDSAPLADTFSQYMVFPGLQVMEMPLRKGECYANDKDGKRIKDANGNDVTKDKVSVLVMIDTIRPGEKGDVITTYVDPFSPSKQLARIEDRFFKTAVNGSNTDASAKFASLLNAPDNNAPHNTGEETKTGEDANDADNTDDVDF